MGDLYHVLSRRVVGDAMDARHLAAADVVDAEHSVGSLMQPPAILAVYVPDDAFGKRDGCALSSVEFMDMVSLFHCHIILRESVHYLCQILVDGGEYCYADGEV